MAISRLSGSGPGGSLVTSIVVLVILVGVSHVLVLIVFGVIRIVFDILSADLNERAQIRRGFVRTP